MDELALLHLLQLADSSLPTGLFAHSFGLEALVQEDLLAQCGADTKATGPTRAGSNSGGGGGPPLTPAQQRANALAAVLRARLAYEQGQVEVPLLFAAHAAALQHDLAALEDLCQLAAATRTVREWRLAAEQAGQRLLYVVADLAPDALPEGLRPQTRVPFPRPLPLCVAFGLVAACLGCRATDAALAYTLQGVMAAAAAAVRLGLFGQRDAQRLVHLLKPDMLAAIQEALVLPLSDLGGSIPLLEIAGMRHEFGDSRLFAS